VVRVVLLGVSLLVVAVGLGGVGGGDVASTAQWTRAKRLAGFQALPYPRKTIKAALKRATAGKTLLRPGTPDLFMVWFVIAWGCAAPTASGNRSIAGWDAPGRGGRCPAAHHPLRSPPTPGVAGPGHPGRPRVRLLATSKTPGAFRRHMRLMGRRRVR